MAMGYVMVAPCPENEDRYACDAYTVTDEVVDLPSWRNETYTTNARFEQPDPSRSAGLYDCPPGDTTDGDNKDNYFNSLTIPRLFPLTEPDGATIYPALFGCTGKNQTLENTFPETARRLIRWGLNDYVDAFYICNQWNKCRNASYSVDGKSKDPANASDQVCKEYDGKSAPQKPDPEAPYGVNCQMAIKKKKDICLNF
ncbi:hypothetical protein TWF225_006043 [Orbilia oligospora]|nr:hypothetical protein TWF225_006043 [Orbilia oligospora]KAF3233471.1 hypothetical protein TWF128_003003 [Orbilia oligospora]KAF3257789.1 hypothetical protein TWF217_005897 [Orbilia oligospora]